MNCCEPLEFDRCPVCGSEEKSTFARARPLDYRVNAVAEIVQCLRCGHAVTQAPFSSFGPLEKFYSSGSYAPRASLVDRIVSRLVLFFESRKLRYFKYADPAQGKDLLEIGCGKGKFLVVAEKMGYRVNGIEPARVGFEAAYRALGERIHHTPIERMREEFPADRKFDIVVMWHVLEHCADIEEAVNIVRGSMTQKAIFLLALPNIDSFQARLGRANWYHLDPPRHLHHFSPKSIKILLERCGLSIAATSYASFAQNFFGEMVTFCNCLFYQKNVMVNVLRRNEYFFKKFGKVEVAAGFAVAMILHCLTAVPALLWSLALQRGRRSGTMVVIAKIKSNV